MLNHSLAVSESCQLLDRASNPRNLFGLTQSEHWKLQMELNQSKMLEMKELVWKELNEGFKSKFETLKNLYLENSDEEELEGEDPKTFCELIEKHKMQVEFGKKEVEASRLKTWQLLSKYCRKLLKLWETLSDVHRINSEKFHHSEVNSTYLVSKLETMILKLE